MSRGSRLIQRCASIYLPWASIIPKPPVCPGSIPAKKVFSILITSINSFITLKRLINQENNLFYIYIVFLTLSY